MTIDSPSETLHDFFDNNKVIERKFEAAPVEIIIEFLQSFSDHSQNKSGDIRQDCPVEKFVLEALAKRLHAFVFSEDKGGTLDAAFGGKVKRQLQQIRADNDAYKSTFKIAVAMQGGCKYEDAIDDVAKELCVSSDTVHDRYKRTGPNGRRKRGGKLKKIHPDQ
jgi:hypothetical protein